MILCWVIKGFPHRSRQSLFDEKARMFVVAFHFIYLKLFSLNTRYTTMSRVYTTANIVGRMIENPFQHLYTVFLKLSKAGFFFFWCGRQKEKFSLISSSPGKSFYTTISRSHLTPANRRHSLSRSPPAS